MRQSVVQELASLTNPGDMPRRIQLCQQALGRVRRIDHPDLWAMLQVELGNSLQLHAGHDRAEHLEHALQAYAAALTVYTPERSPEQWAIVQGNIGNVYQDRIRGPRAENVERAIEAYQAALTVYTRDAFPHPWALMQNNLGNAYWRRIRGDRADNLEQAIIALAAALTVRTREQSPLDWAMTQNNLGNAYRDRIGGDPADNLEHAIAAFQAALSVFTPDTFCWAQTQNNLGIAYLSRLGGVRAENLEDAMHAFQLALMVFHRDTTPEQWAMAKHNLGNAYSNCIAGDRTENLERAIEAYTDALSVHTPEAFPADWAMTQSCLGTAYRERLREDRADNIERAIHAYDNALRVYTRAAFPIDWAMTQMNLGTAYRRRMRGDRANNLECAIGAYEAALTVCTRDHLPELWAGVQNNLGGAYLERISGERADNLERAIAAFQAALTVHTREGFPEQWANIQNNLGNTYAERIYGERAQNLSLAGQAYQATLEVHVPDQWPSYAFGTARNLVRLQCIQQHWREAYAAGLIALTAAERLYAASLTTESKTVEREANASLYQQMVDVCLRLDPPRPLEAFLYTEEGRARILRDQLGALPLSPPPTIPLTMLEHEAQLLQDLRSLAQWIRDAPDVWTRRRWVDEAATTRRALDALWDTLTRDYGASDYVALRRGTKLEWSDVQTWLTAQGRRVVLLAFFTLRDRLVTFIARAGESEPVVVPLDISPHRQMQFVQRFSREVRYRFDEWQRLTETWQTLGPLFVPPLMPHLEGADLVYVMPHALLHTLPLHALEYEGQPLTEYFSIAYAPSVAVAVGMTRAARVPLAAAPGHGAGRARMLVVGNPTGDLPRAEAVAKKVAERFGAQLLLSREATKERVLAALGDATEAYVAAHAYYTPSDPLASGIRLAYGSCLTARDMLARSLNIRRLVLHGCATGALDILPGDELEGLASAWLCAGVSSLVCSLWEVRDDVTETLMLRFYDALAGSNGIPPMTTVDALRAALRDTRQRRRWRHTYFWAPFVLYGDWR